VLSGGVSQYNAQQACGPANYLDLIFARAAMTGFLTPDYADRYPEARAELAGWLQEGREPYPLVASRHRPRHARR